MPHKAPAKKTGEPTREFCAIHTAQQLIGGKWTLIVVWHLRSGRLRFGEIERAIGDVSQKALTDALKHLDGAGLITRTVFAEVPPRVEYALTPLGRTLLPIVEAIETWIERHQADLTSGAARPVVA
ncbi:MAG: helix-turn-helix transcriptional regulator [Planctomycetes bacterium]|jgi:DNA-binding HxlR family transcriptional regulator|nr:helix-turn-helix transcriptional regulator [Planctomycetota bacterium]